LRSLRAGAIEFLSAPFDPGTQGDAYRRLQRVAAPELPPQPAVVGRVVAFTSSKPGSGASTLAAQTAFSLQRLTGKRVLLADCDLAGGTIAFYLKLSHAYSMVDALQHAERLDTGLWRSLTVACQGVDVLPAPAIPFAEPVDAGRLRALSDHARSFYDWVVLDLPSVFHPNSLLTVTDCDLAFLISTTDLASLHMMRKAIQMVNQLGFPKERFQVLVNRAERQDDVSVADMEKLFGCAVHARLPSDYFSLHRVVTLGQPLGGEGALGRAIENVARNLAGAFPVAPPEGTLRPALSGA
jgi:pilus assembly protein CpaE